MNPPPDYGIDAPGLVRAFFVAGASAIAVSLAASFSPWPGGFAGVALAIVAGSAAAYALFMGSLMVYWSRRVKLRDRERLLDCVPWRGDEAVLDVGCGRGLMVVGAARRVPRGQAVGIDVWSAADQSDNRPEAALENARREGVAERVRVQTADARELPFGDGSFDAVVSHWVIHNLEPAADRERALREIVRVLQPGGTLILADIQFADAYAAELARAGLGELRRLGHGWLGALAAPLSGYSFVPVTLIGRKPA